MTTWVLVRGLARESRHWGDFARVLHDVLPPGDSVWTPDLPGNGRRHHERSVGIAAMADGLHRALHERPGGGPCVVVALSLGGMVALEWSRRWPADLAACVLINSSDARHARPWHRLRPAALLQLVAAALARDVAARERRILQLTSNRPVDPEVARRWTAWARGCPTTAANALRQLIAAARFRSGGGAPPVPLLLLASAQDRVVASRCSQALADAWHVPLRLHPAAGHDLTLDDPRWAVSQILGWAGASFR